MCFQTGVILATFWLLGKSSSMKSSGSVADTVDDSAKLGGMVSGYVVGSEEIDTTHLFQPVQSGDAVSNQDGKRPNPTIQFSGGDSPKPSAQVHPFTQHSQTKNTPAVDKGGKSDIPSPVKGKVSENKKKSSKSRKANRERQSEEIEHQAVEDTLKYIKGKTIENEERKQSLIEIPSTLGQKEDSVGEEVEESKTASSRNSSVRFSVLPDDIQRATVSMRRKSRNASIISIPSQRGRRPTLHCMSIACAIL